MPRQTIANAAYEELAGRRAATSAVLAEPIAAAGLTRAASPTTAVTRALGEDPRFCRLADDRWTVPEVLLADAVVTHRPTPEERRHAALALVPDLAPLTTMAVYRLQTSEGTPLRPVWGAEARELTGVDTDAALQGPPGWLDGSNGAPLLHIRLAGARVEVSWGSEPAASSRMRGRRIVETLRRSLEHQPRFTTFGLPPGVSLGNELLQMLIDEPDLLRTPLAPLVELFDGVGLEVHRGWVGHDGTDWEAIDEFMDFDEDWASLDGEDLVEGPGGGSIWDEPLHAEAEDEDDAAATERLATEFGLGEEEIQGLQIVLGAYLLDRRGRGLDDRETLAGIAAVVADPGVADVLARLASKEADFEPFMARIEQAAVGPHAAGPRYLLAACAEAGDDVTLAEEWLRGSLDADRQYLAAAFELARFETDRGRYGEALRLLREAGVPADDDERAWLEGVSRSALPKVGRNEPCPCGSGRKYKACHLGREGDVGAVDPVAALMHKLWLWQDQLQTRRVRSEVVDEVVPRSTRAEQDEEERENLEGPLLDDVVLFDRGELERFLRVRSALLPERELELGRSWLATQRSLYEVRSVRPGTGLRVRDLLADEAEPEVELRDRTLSRQVDRLDLLCLRLVPDGAGGLAPSNGLLVPRLQRSRLIEIMGTGDAMELLGWLAHPIPLPRMANMEGEPLRLVTATYRLTDPAATAAALGRKLRDDGDGRFVDTVVRDGQEWHRGSISIEGEIATLETNSTQRADRLERTLMQAAPGSRLIRREERGMEEALEAHRETRSEGDAAADEGWVDPADHPEVAAALEQMMRGYEERWVNESIPALDGMTPRQAMADQTMRRRLEALLDDMTWQAQRSSGSGMMDPRRVRGRLGFKD